MARPTIKWPKPWDPAPFDEADHMAMKALAKGVANDVQQKVALDFIYRMSGAKHPSFWPENARGTDFAEGKKFVWSQVLGAINFVPSKRS